MKRNVPSLDEVFLFREARGDSWPAADMFAKKGAEDLPTTQIRPGTRFFHGTAVCRDFKIPRGPAHFTTKERLAWDYAYFESYNQTNTCPRILVLQTKARLANIIDIPEVPGYGRGEYSDAVYWLKQLTGTSFSGIGTQRIDGAAEALKKLGFNGYYQRNIDGGGPDLMLFEPERWLSFVEIKTDVPEKLKKRYAADG